MHGEENYRSIHWHCARQPHSSCQPQQLQDSFGVKSVNCALHISVQQNLFCLLRALNKRQPNLVMILCNTSLTQQYQESLGNGSGCPYANSLWFLPSLKSVHAGLGPKACGHERAMFWYQTTVSNWKYRGEQFDAARCCQNHLSLYCRTRCTLSLAMFSVCNK